MDQLISERFFTPWPVVYRLCSIDIAQGKFDRLDARLLNVAKAKNKILSGQVIAQFPRVLNHIADRQTLNKKLTLHATSAKRLLQQTQTMQTTLKNLCLENNGTVALVGNGPSIQTSAAGPIIDAQDVVIRFNNTGVNDSYDEDLGQKTTIWVISPSTSVRNHALSLGKTVCAVTGPDPWTRPSHYWRKARLGRRIISTSKCWDTHA